MSLPVFQTREEADQWTKANCSAVAGVLIRALQPTEAVYGDYADQRGLADTRRLKRYVERFRRVDIPAYPPVFFSAG